ncbi:MAG: extracellular solute-binding protein [Candidatus Lustribacter sp.]|jgi:iron(III) transport system substrate-binding protein
MNVFRWMCSAMLVLAASAAAGNSGAAKNEGVVVWYATMNTTDMDQTANEFMRTHPGITVKELRSGSAQLPARIVTEQRAGEYNADVISGDFVQVSQLVASGAFDAYVPPEAGKFIRGTVDPHGYWTNLYQNTTVIAWNPQRLASDHLKPPASFADFARPEWKGKFGFDTGALNWYLGMLQSAGPAGAQLARNITANEPLKTTGHTQTVTSLETGEFDATPTAYGYMAEAEKRAGKTIDFRNPSPLFVTLNPVGIAKHAPHPNAARLFIDWLTSKAGQTYIVNRGGGEISSRSDVRNNPQIFDPKRPYVIIAAPDSVRYNQLNAQFRELLGLPG